MSYITATACFFFFFQDEYIRSDRLDAENVFHRKRSPSIKSTKNLDYFDNNKFHDILHLFRPTNFLSYILTKYRAILNVVEKLEKKETNKKRQIDVSAVTFTVHLVPKKNKSYSLRRDNPNHVRRILILMHEGGFTTFCTYLITMRNSLPSRVCHAQAPATGILSYPIWGKMK